MERSAVAKLTREKLDEHGLTDWKVRITVDQMQSFLGLCVYKDKTIIINAHHCDIHPDAEVVNTVLHEVAHALCPGQQHNSVWAAKAREIGCTSVGPCSHLDLPENIIDAIRSGQMVEMTIETETYTVQRPKYTVTRIQEKCPICGKVAKEKFSREVPDKNGDTVKWITLECFHIIQKRIPRSTPYQELVTNWWKPEIQACKHEWIKTRCGKCGEFKEMDFQVKGSRFIEAALAQGKGVLLADEMGLGKTIQALAYMKFSKKRGLYIVKSAITFQWFKEIIRIIGPEGMPQIITTSRDPILPGLRSYIISYDLLRRMDKKKLAQINPDVVILDECQQIKNPDSTRTQEVRRIVGNPTVKVIAMSGTPWQNRGSEFFPVLNMIDPIKFHSYQNFLNRWVQYYWHGDKQKMGGIRNIPAFKEYTEQLVIRREYDEVMDEFPDVNRMKLSMQLDEMSQSNYDHAESDFVKWYNQHVIDGTEDSIGSIEILAQMTRARHIIGLAKIPATLGMLEEFYEETDRSIVVFVHHKDVAQILLEEMKKKFPDVNVESLAASHTDLERFEIAQRFGVKRTFLVASTLACGEGIDGLQKGYDSILHERQWNPAKEDQATPGRFKRIGQKSSVINLTCVHADETIDMDFDDIVERKRLFIHQAMNKGELQTWSETDIAKEMAARIIARHNRKNKGKKVKVTELARVR